MIGLGAKYLTAAGFGRYRITAASLGSNLMFGSLWLKDATKQAIMAAFGVDGLAVIKATNEYLNGIAASDKAKATALAGFINASPTHAVGYATFIYEYQEVEYIQGTGSQWLKIPFDVTGGFDEYRMKYIPTENSAWISGQWTNGSGQGWNLDTYNDWRFWLGYGGSPAEYPLKQNYTGLALNQLVDLAYDRTSGNLTINGQTKPYTQTSIPNSLQNIFIFALGFGNNKQNQNAKGKMIEHYARSANSEIWVKACYNKTSGVIGMYDVANGAFYTNQGSGTFGKGADVTPTP